MWRCYIIAFCFPLQSKTQDCYANLTLKAPRLQSGRSSPQIQYSDVVQLEEPPESEREDDGSTDPVSTMSDLYASVQTQRTKTIDPAVDGEGYANHLWEERALWCWNTTNGLCATWHTTTGWHSVVCHEVMSYLSWLNLTCTSFTREWSMYFLGLLCSDVSVREKHSIVNFPVSLNCWFYNCVMFTEIIPIDN